MRRPAGILCVVAQKQVPHEVADMPDFVQRQSLLVLHRQGHRRTFCGEEAHPGGPDDSGDDRDLTSAEQ